MRLDRSARRPAPIQMDPESPISTQAERDFWQRAAATCARRLAEKNRALDEMLFLFQQWRETGAAVPTADEMARLIQRARDL